MDGIPLHMTMGIVITTNAIRASNDVETTVKTLVPLVVDLLVETHLAEAMEAIMDVETDGETGIAYHRGEIKIPSIEWLTHSLMSSSILLEPVRKDHMGCHCSWNKAWRSALCDFLLLGIGCLTHRALRLGRTSLRFSSLSMLSS